MTDEPKTFTPKEKAWRFQLLRLAREIYINGKTAGDVVLSFRLAANFLRDEDEVADVMTEHHFKGHAE